MKMTPLTIPLAQVVEAILILVLVVAVVAEVEDLLIHPILIKMMRVTVVMILIHLMMGLVALEKKTMMITLMTNLVITISIEIFSRCRGS